MALPMAPSLSNSSVFTSPVPSLPMVVRAERQIHSPVGSRKRATDRSTFMKRYSAGFKATLIPLPESATTSVRLRGEVSSPATSGTRWRIQTVPAPTPSLTGRPSTAERYPSKWPPG